jgi:hypothetical protein
VQLAEAIHRSGKASAYSRIACWLLVVGCYRIGHDTTSSAVGCDVAFGHDRPPPRPAQRSSCFMRKMNPADVPPSANMNENFRRSENRGVSKVALLWKHTS